MHTKSVSESCFPLHVVSMVTFLYLFNPFAIDLVALSGSHGQMCWTQAEYSIWLWRGKGLLADPEFKDVNLVIQRKSPSASNIFVTLLVACLRRLVNESCSHSGV
mmetsp:Transcript_87766/g.139385  ORF Transcript_87766/g.139385 Transcript_87766/m.139385 type:complete len:105 (+) Transcript_87766:1799-2113(+)